MKISFALATMWALGIGVAIAVPRKDITCVFTDCQYRPICSKHVVEEGSTCRQFGLDGIYVRESDPNSDSCYCELEQSKIQLGPDSDGEAVTQNNSDLEPVQPISPDAKPDLEPVPPIHPDAKPVPPIYPDLNPVQPIFPNAKPEHPIYSSERKAESLNFCYNSCDGDWIQPMPPPCTSGWLPTGTPCTSAEGYIGVYARSLLDHSCVCIFSTTD